MTIEDYDGLKKLWLGIEGFGIRSIDDSYEGVCRFLERNPRTSVVAEDGGQIVGPDIFIMSASGRIIGCTALEKRWPIRPWRH